MYKKLLLILPLIFFSCNSDQSKQERKKWKHLNESLLAKPQANIASKLKRGIVLPTCFVAETIIASQILINKTKFYNEIKIILGIAFVACTTYAVNNQLKTKDNSDAEFDSVKTFMQTWPESKASTPECMHNALDKVYKLCQKHESALQELNDFMLPLKNRPFYKIATRLEMHKKKAIMLNCEKYRKKINKASKPIKEMAKEFSGNNK